VGVWGYDAHARTGLPALKKFGKESIQKKHSKRFESGAQTKGGGKEEEFHINPEKHFNAG